MKNKLKRILSSGQTAIGTWISMTDPYGVEMVAALGFDWLLIDMEHGPVDMVVAATVTFRRLGFSAPYASSAMVGIVPVDAFIAEGAECMNSIFNMATGELCDSAEAESSIGHQRSASRPFKIHIRPSLHGTIVNSLDSMS